jgi:hypothetical protein
MLTILNIEDPIHTECDVLIVPVDGPELSGIARRCAAYLPDDYEVEYQQAWKGTLSSGEPEMYWRTASLTETVENPFQPWAVWWCPIREGRMVSNLQHILDSCKDMKVARIAIADLHTPTKYINEETWQDMLMWCTVARGFEEVEVYVDEGGEERIAA